MDQVKMFNITGYVKKGGKKITFTKDVKALKESHALEKIYSEIGSRHKAKRFDIKVTKVQESEKASEEPRQE
jgi:large subunit ribosomal protein LX